MLFNSTEFLIFLPIVVLGYFVVPAKVKNLWLLIASYFFYMCWNAKYAVLILTSTVITYCSGIFIDIIKNSSRSEEAKVRLKKLCVCISVVLNLAILFYYKYTNFFLEVIHDALAGMNINLVVPSFDIILPVGISFYTFQALSYTMDIYRDEIYAEKNFINYALFVSFFPQLVAGPIERSKNLLKQVNVIHKFSYDNLQEGILLMLWGYFLKLVIADRSAIVVDTVYSDVEKYGGCYLIVAIVLFAFQIYCDFYGYSTIAKGAAKILGIDLMENFEYPFLRTSIADFWRGWHISLSTWFRDYLYFPLGGSKKGKLRKYLNLMIVFLASGLWHGAAVGYVIWGGINGLLQAIGDMLMPLRRKVRKLFGLDMDSLGVVVTRIIITFILFLLSLIFFRADTVELAVDVYESIFTKYNPWILFDGSLFELGLDSKNFRLLIICILVVLFADICKMKKVVIRDIVIRQNILARCAFIVFVVMFILIFGIWGQAYEAANFIYFQF